MARQLHQFPGGLVLEDFKALSNQSAIKKSHLPPRLYYPLQQHIGTPATPLVSPGDQVLKGQLIASASSYVSCPIHAASSGKVISNKPYQSIVGGNGIVIETDGHDQWVEKMPALNINTSIELLQQRLIDSGIAGLGGAGFPVHVKACEAATNQVKTLIINGVECEPYISCDDRLIRERTKDLVKGAKILQRMVGAKECIFAVEDDMPEALCSLEEAVNEDQDVISVPKIYPAGGEKQLIQTLTGKVIRSHELPIQSGLLMQNVATVVAIFDAVIKGEPLIKRVVTVTGEVATPGNFEVLHGTSAGEIVSQAEGDTSPGKNRVIMGGAMMGLLLKSDQTPLTKTSNCLLVQKQKPAPVEMACIRCGDCLDVCPALLQPQALYAASKNEHWSEAKNLQLFDCIECGCCTYVCPSQIPLVDYFQLAKQNVQEIERAKQRAYQSKQRYETRNARQFRLKLEKNQAREKVKTERADKARMQDEIRQSIKRAQARRKKSN